jgi:hypothetical protein
MPLPHPLVPFAVDGDGNSYCLDTARLVDAECPVVLWKVDTRQDHAPSIIHPTFLDWLQDAVERAIEQELETARASRNLAAGG